MWISLLSCRNRNFKAPWVGFSSLVGLSGLEPPTSRLSGGRSNQLSYKPIFSGLVLLLLKPLVEISGIEPLTPCLQSRCSPSWAIPPYLFRVGPWKLNNKLEIHSDLGYELLSFTHFSIERRWSSRTFRYGYLVTTSPQSPILPSAASSRGWTTDFGYYRLPWCDGRCVQGPGTYSPRHADPRLLAIPTSCRRVAACNLNWERF